MTQLPAGVVTFLFSDIEASTRLLYRLGGEDFLALVERHRVVMRTAFAAHSGHEFNTEGDSFCVAFERAGDAVGAALDAQGALAREGFGDAGVRVRMGLHTGEGLVAEGDYYGLAVHQAARIAAAAHGGQVLVSATTGSHVEDALPEGARFDDLGEHRLKDLERPHRLLQLRHRDLASEFPPPRSLEIVTHNLPVQTSS
ncbi:MAG: adenylate/guanylate cyclase domain-containing protein, partial [Actinobacteria bacterium]|nr:adenylate/guanylate cyclase domain-containing protein [Actinomycetota bacterium]